MQSGNIIHRFGMEQMIDKVYEKAGIDELSCNMSNCLRDTVYHYKKVHDHHLMLKDIY